MRFKDLNLNLGLPSLLSEWKSMLSPKFFLADLTAGLTVAFIAIPLSLAIALASGVSPGVGLITAIVGGVVCGFFGGTPLAVSGPAAAMTILIADIVERHGVESLILVCMVAGIMQLASGIFGLGKLARYIPLPVIAGFTAGIGVIILIGQLPRAFGLVPPSESHIFSVFNHLSEYFHEINGTCLFIVVTTIGIIRGLPKVLPKLPSILPAVVVSTLIVNLFNLTDVPLIGAIPSSLPVPQMPRWPNISSSEILFSAFTIYVLASLETLLSSSAIDKITQGKKHNPNQELIGQGLGNIAASLFSGIPITGVIARSATNVRAGAKTRRSSIIHAIIILLAVYLVSPLISLIPIAALAGVLLSVAFSMINVKEVYDLWQSSRGEALIYAVTFLTIIFVDLIAGVQAGIIAAAIIVLWKATNSYSYVSTVTRDNVIRFSLSGPLTFLSTGKIADVEKKIQQANNNNKTVLLDLSHVSNVDTSGATSICDLYQTCKERGVNFYIKGLSRKFESLFRICGGNTLLDNHYVVFEHELRKEPSSYGRLIHGIHRFHSETINNDRRLFDYISKRQDPHTLFVACSDSRIIPSMITSTDPGELFIIRNVGNCIPPYDEKDNHSEVAALEFALSSFSITDIVICGHANCGAIEACRNPDKIPTDTNLKSWIGMIRSKLTLDESLPLNDIARLNVLNQINNLKTYPFVQEKLATRALMLHAWFFDFEQKLVYAWDHADNTFKSVIDEMVLEHS